MSWACRIVALVLTLATASAAAEVHVSPAGSDADPGTGARPFATLARARDAVRAWEALGAHRGEAVDVVLHGGRYRLSDPLLLTPLDSGTAGAPVTWRAAPGELPIVSGGTPLTGWREEDGGLWSAPVPWAPDLDERCTQLFVDGVRRPRARTPNEGAYLYTKRLHMRAEQCEALTVRPEDVGPWITDEGAVVCLFHNWVNSYNRVASADPPRGSITFARPAGGFFLGPSVRYYVENVRAALDAPGEWWLDRAARRILYHPSQGEDSGRWDAVASVASPSIVKLLGAPDFGLWVEHVRFEGISFQHSGADLSPSYAHSAQGANTQRGAVLAVGAREVEFTGCEFAHLGEHAVTLREACESVTIERCLMHDLGGGGVYLSVEAPVGGQEWRMVTGTTVRNNLIHDGGRIFRAGCGVFLGGAASHNRVLHNEIRDLSWVGVHVGWSWTGLLPTHTHHNEIAWNHIHHLGNGVLNDLGGIYTLGVSPGTTLHHNHIHDITRYERGALGYGGWGIYLDAGSSGIAVENNVVHDTRDGGLHLHCYASPHDDIVRNNVFAYSSEGAAMRNALDEPEGLHATIEGNIFLNANPTMLWGTNWGVGSHFLSDGNVFWSESTEAPVFGGLSFDEWQAAGRDVASLIADPLFVDPAGRDFRFRPESPAMKLGIAPIDLSAAGLEGSEEWRGLPATLPTRGFEAAPPPEAAARTVNLDWEDYEPGETPDGAVEASGATSAVVAPREDGGRCLVFTDGPADALWKPHWFVRRARQPGPVRLDILVRVDPESPAEFEIEFRDWPETAGIAYKTGPLIRFGADGEARAADGAAWRALGHCAPGVWTKLVVEIAADAASWSARLGDSPAEATGLACRSPEFGLCDWVGVVGTGETPGRFAIDSLLLQ